METRADMALVERGLVSSRTKAQNLIADGSIYLNGHKLPKPSQKISETDVLEIRGDICPYVSRGGYKLEKALTHFGVDPTDCVAIDIGASTGGFTDVLLINGAKRVYAVDVGTSQLDEKLRRDPRVICMEQTNARTLTREQFDPVPVLGVMDVSFISILKILPALRNVLGDDGCLLSLIKPQFEAGRKALDKHGIVTDPKEHIRVLREIVSFAPAAGWQVCGYTVSPIKGGDGNIEYLAHLVPDTRKVESVTDEVIRSLVLEAHSKRKQ